MTKKSKKEIVADAALFCFLASGYSATSVDEISKASGVSKGGIYWHFKGKEDIFLYLVSRCIDQWQTDFLTSLQESHSAADKLTLYMEQHLKKTNTAIPALILEFMQQAKEKESIQKMHREFNRSADVILKIVEKAIAEGEFKPLDPQIVSLSFLSIFYGVGLQLLTHDNKQLLEKTMRTSLDIFFNGVLA